MYFAGHEMWVVQRDKSDPQKFRALGSLAGSANVPHMFLMTCCGCDPATGDLQNPKWTGAMAKEYPFVLDPFQQVTIACLVRQYCPALHWLIR